MSSQEIKEIIFELSRNNENFPILDLAKIIADYIYEIPTKCVQTLSGHKSAITSLIELKKGLLASGSFDDTIKIWRKQAAPENKLDFSNNWLYVRTLSGHDESVRTLIELQDGSLASGSYDHTIKIWKKHHVDPDNWLCVQTLTGHNDMVLSIIELKNNLLASGSRDRTIKIWRKKQVGSDNWMCVQTLSGHAYGISSIIELKGGQLASGSNDHTIKIWGENAGIFEDGGKTCFSCIQTLSGHTDEICTLIELKDGSLASGSSDTTVKVWKDGKCVQTLSGHNDVISSIIELKDGSLASGSWDQTIKIWKEGKCVQTLSGHNDVISSIIELKDGSLASGSWDQTIKIWT